MPTRTQTIPRETVAQQTKENKDAPFYVEFLNPKGEVVVKASGIRDNVVVYHDNVPLVSFHTDPEGDYVRDGSKSFTFDLLRATYEFRLPYQEKLKGFVSLMDSPQRRIPIARYAEWRQGRTVVREPANAQDRAMDYALSVAKTNVFRFATPPSTPSHNEVSIKEVGEYTKLVALRGAKVIAKARTHSHTGVLYPYERDGVNIPNGSYLKFADWLASLPADVVVQTVKGTRVVA
jgi:hypothetical protein